uniref:Uncharacterized protein n=1 Tax=Catagonus wagneri TaxID=51154 RepID=A0A8C3X9Q4_9CETA
MKTQKPRENRRSRVSSQKKSQDMDTKGAFSDFCCVRDTQGKLPLWLQDTYRPLNATRKKNMAQKLHDKESSDEEGIYSRDLCKVQGLGTQQVLDS